MRIFTVGICVLCLSSLAFSASFADRTHAADVQDDPILDLRLAANVGQVERGIPILLKVTLANPRREAFPLVGSIGWGRSLGFKFRRRNQEAQWLRRDVPHLDTDIGGIPVPLYVFTGTLNAADSQELVQVIRSTDMDQGAVRFSVWMRVRTPQGRLVELESEEVAVKIVEPQLEQGGARTFTADEVRVVSRAVADNHNYRSFKAFQRGRRHDAVAAAAKKALELNAKDLLAEYALYAAVVEERAEKATQEDLAFAGQAAKAFFERFPDSWLRAHVYAALFEIDPERAEELTDDPFALPGAELLFDNLGILDDVRKAVPTKPKATDDEQAPTE